MKTEYGGPTPISSSSISISFHQAEIDALLKRMVRDGYLQGDHGGDEHGLWFWLQRAVEWGFSDENKDPDSTPFDSMQAGLILRKMFEWRRIVFFGMEIPEHYTELEKTILSQLKI